MHRAAAIWFLLIAFASSAAAQDRTGQPPQDAAPAPAAYAPVRDELAAARAQFVRQCLAVAADESYCGCLYAKLPPAYTHLVDQPWLLFVISMYERKYVGELIENDTEDERFQKYLLARSAVGQCADGAG